MGATTTTMGTAVPREEAAFLLTVRVSKSMPPGIRVELDRKSRTLTISEEMLSAYDDLGMILASYVRAMAGQVKP
jgi:hypothetical protein